MSRSARKIAFRSMPRVIRLSSAPLRVYASLTSYKKSVSRKDEYQQVRDVPNYHKGNLSLGSGALIATKPLVNPSAHASAAVGISKNGLCMLSGICTLLPRLL